MIDGDRNKKFSLVVMQGATGKAMAGTETRKARRSLIKKSMDCFPENLGFSGKGDGGAHQRIQSSGVTSTDFHSERSLKRQEKWLGAGAHSVPLAFILTFIYKEFEQKNDIIYIIFKG